MSLDGALIEEATAGINAPVDGDQNAIVRVNDAQAPELPNLRYQTVDSFAQEMALPLANEIAAAAESPVDTYLTSSDTYVLDLPLTAGYVYHAELMACVQNGAGAVAFYELQRVIVSYPTSGSPSVLEADVLVTHGPDFVLTPSISGTNLRASLESGSFFDRHIDVTIGLVRARQIPGPF